MLSDAQIKQFHRDGFLNAGPMLSEKDLSALSDALDDAIRRGPDGFPEGSPRPVLFRDLYAGGGGDYTAKTLVTDQPVWQILNIWEGFPVFRNLIYNPAVVSAISQLSGFTDLQVWHDQVQYKPPRAGGPALWHQDAPLWPSIEPMTPVSAWIPFDDAEVSNGCMWMVPGSHRWGNQRPYLDTMQHLRTVDEFTRFLPFTPPAGAEIRTLEPRACPVRRGEVHFHHSLTWHGSPQNLSERPRRAIAIHYMSSDARYTGKEHAMSRFISLKPGETMAAAGPHFPRVMRTGKPVEAPA
jgi:ectoine hydroxylase-related dioxygenase (phytanoyl-CoA dioxygenase family)